MRKLKGSNQFYLYSALILLYSVLGFCTYSLFLQLIEHFFNINIVYPHISGAFSSKLSWFLIFFSNAIYSLIILIVFRKFYSVFLFISISIFLTIISFSTILFLLNRVTGIVVENEAIQTIMYSKSTFFSFPMLLTFLLCLIIIILGYSIKREKLES